MRSSLYMGKRNGKCFACIVIFSSYLVADRYPAGMRAMTTSSFTTYVKARFRALEVPGH